MANNIHRKELWRALPNIKRREQWIKAAQQLGLPVTQPLGGSSHYAIRKPNIPITDIKSLVVNVYEPCRKDVNEIIFKKLMENGCSEDDIWKALGML